MEIEAKLKSGDISEQLEQKIEDFGKGAKKGRGRSIYYSYKGRVMFHQEKYDDAIDYFDDGIDEDENYVENHFWRGKSYLEELKTANFMTTALYASKSLSSFEKAVEVDPNHIDARLNLAGYYQNAPAIGGGSNTKAIEQYEAVNKLNSSIGYSHFMLGRLYEGEEEFDKADSCFKKAIEVDPENGKYQGYYKKFQSTRGGK
jgi:tetratricopeptide (TPR) repeat protein